MKISGILFRFFSKYGKIGLTTPSWKGSYEPKVPSELVKSIISQNTSSNVK